VTAGIASATGRRDVPLNGEMVYQDFIQTDASINPGNSGGPLLDIKGRVVGINTAISSEGQGIGFAIPINMVQEILPQLKETGKVKRSWLGIYVDEVPGALSKQLALAPGGALIKGVVPKGPADLAKLREGDVIIKLDGTSINDASHLTWVAGHLGIGKVVDVELQRGNQRMMTRMKLGALPD
jgi:serine protease Do